MYEIIRSRRENSRGSVSLENKEFVETLIWGITSDLDFRRQSKLQCEGDWRGQTEERNQLRGPYGI